MNNTANNTASQPPLPQLQSVAPSIFVPVTRNLLAPFDPPRSRVERLRAILAHLDEHHAAVGANLHALFDYEHARLAHEASVAERDFRQQQQQQQQEEATAEQPQCPAARVRLSTDEVDRMIANMEAPAAQSFGGGAPLLGFPEVMELDQQRELTPREAAAKKLAKLLTQFSIEINGFKTHVRKTRAFYEQALERELENEAR